MTDSGAIQVLVPDGDAASILHRSGVELRHEDLGVIGKWIRHPEGAFEDGEATLGDGKDSLGVQVGFERAATGDGEGDGGAVLAAVLSRTVWNWPATMAVMQVEIGGVGANCQRARPSFNGVGVTSGELDSTLQSAGATTLILKAAFRSGCSKQA